MNIENKNPNPNKDQLQHVREAKKENKFIGSLRPKKNHKMYKFHEGVLSELKDEDYFDDEVQVKQSPFARVVSVDKDGNHYKVGNRKTKVKINEQIIFKNVRKIRIEANTDYFSALNIDSAKKICAKRGYVIRLIDV